MFTAKLPFSRRHALGFFFLLGCLAIIRCRNLTRIRVDEELRVSSKSSLAERCTPPFVVTMTLGRSGSSLLNDVIHDNTAFKKFKLLSEFFGEGTLGEKTCCKNVTAYRALFSKKRKDSRKYLANFRKMYGHILKAQDGGFDDALDFFRAFHLAKPQIPHLFQLKSYGPWGSDELYYSSLPAYKTFSEYLSRRIKVHEAFVIRNTRNILDATLSELRHRRNGAITGGLCDSECWRLKLAAKLTVDNLETFSKMLHVRRQRRRGIDNFFTKYNISSINVEYEKLFSSDEKVRQRAWCGVEVQMKKTFCKSTCAMRYINGKMCGQGVGTGTWCKTFAKTFQRPAPFQNHIDFIENAKEVYDVLPADVRMSWRGPVPE